MDVKENERELRMTSAERYFPKTASTQELVGKVQNPVLNGDNQGIHHFNIEVECCCLL